MTNSHLPENWSYDLVDSQIAFSDRSLRLRKSRLGPEENLIRSFLLKLKVKAEPEVRLTIFKEPCLETGSPDLVGVIWHLPTAEKWNRNRFLLQPIDFRVLQQLSHLQDSGMTSIENLLCRQKWASLDRLQAASMVSIDRGEVSVSPLSSVYAVKHIFAIEAKIGAWRKALRQAFLNRWFATSSHVLLPRMPSSGAAIAEARSLGVGLWGPEVSKLTLNLPTTTSGPVSYASWLFNEWAWKIWSNSPTSYVGSKHSYVD